MILRWAEQTAIPKECIRGGVGPAVGMDYLKPGEMAGISAMGRTVLAPGSTIGEHAHPDSEELYLILEGRGTGILNGTRFPLQTGDAFLLKAGGSHGLENDSEAPLVFFAVLTSAR